MINPRAMQAIIAFIRECIRIAGLVISGTHIKLKNKISQKFGDRSGAFKVYIKITDNKNFKVGVSINHSLNLTKGVKIVRKRRNITLIRHINIKKEIGFPLWVLIRTAHRRLEDSERGDTVKDRVFLYKIEHPPKGRPASKEKLSIPQTLTARKSSLIASI